MDPNASDGSRPDVELRLPADGAYVSVLRTTAAGLAARLDFTLDDIEDLRMAVGEAASIVLEAADPGADLSAAFWLGSRALRMRVAVGAAGAQAPATDSFAWQVLTTLAQEASAEASGEELAITLSSVAIPLDAPPGGGEPHEVHR